jgi:GTP-sensing pleiotropic transcriptional regulator CodY
VTLNMPPELYRELDRWTSSAADAIGVPRVSIQDALRAMVKAGMRDSTAEAAVLAELRRQEPTS